jgi:putrescine transport system ATP-binding protein
MARLIVDRVTKTFGAFRALDGVSLDVRDGELMAFLGPKGCGEKTAAADCRFRQLCDGGRIVIGETVVSAVAQHVPPSGAASASSSSRTPCGRT